MTRRVKCKIVDIFLIAVLELFISGGGARLEVASNVEKLLENVLL